MMKSYLVVLTATILLALSLTAFGAAEKTDDPVGPGLRDEIRVLQIDISSALASIRAAELTFRQAQEQLQPKVTQAQEACKKVGKILETKGLTCEEKPKETKK